MFVRIALKFGNFTKFSMHVACYCGSVLLIWRCDTLRISGFVDDVMFAYDERDVKMAYV